MAEQNTDVAATQTQGVPGLPPDWAQQGTNKVIDVVDQVRSKTTGPAIGISRKVVYGLVAGILALFLVPMFIIMVFHLLGSWGNIWIAYLGFGAFFVLAGLMLWRKRPSGVAGT